MADDVGQGTERPFLELSIDELRERVALIRSELAERSVRSARRLREEIDPNFSIDRPRNCCVYAIELSDDVREVTKFQRKNPHMRTDRPCLYIGSTWKSPEERFREHREGADRSASIPRDYGVRLRPAFVFMLEDLTREQAESREAELAGLLRDQNYGIWQG